MRLTLAALMFSLVTMSVAGPPYALVLTQTPDFYQSLDPKWLIGQAGLLITVLVLLKLLANREIADRERNKSLDQILRENASANNAHALSVARNTDAMLANTKSNETLADEVRRLSERRFEEQRKQSS
jgi:hypothetical protein